jgi:secreted Zn-dependent insulinase-like peptidase
VFSFTHPDRLTRIENKLDALLKQLGVIQTQEITMDAATQKSIDALNTTVEALPDVETSIETLLKGQAELIAQLKTGQTDPAVLAAIDAATAIVSADIARAKAAVIANTPAA